MDELINRDDHAKLYLQLYTILKKKIENQEWYSSMQIPTEEQLCRMFNVSRATVRNALMELVRQGYLIRQQGKGTFVSKNFISEDLIMATVFKKLWFENDSIFTEKIVAKTVMMPVGNLSNELNIPENKHVIYIKIIWFAEKDPTMIQESFIPFNICPQLIEENIGHQSIIELLEKKYNIKTTRVHNYFELIFLNKEVSSYFELEENFPAILMNQKVFSGDTVILVNKFYKKMDNHKIFIAFQRKAL
ncbi:GntR family transcriptional regulator [Thermodesulfovibrio thiophilus]|uniref:GntR family transcriptional regulator n=1 Tax=Thermodesulfovibrio thiophilus TaxID=340095 RepID=UPI0018539F4D|nr:GntR family transcriptional regulator [Thermodesulfovibrio thiophilus]HHW20080.1 GntR family transcriptional regulator [Thermodesulfovibrio thiophilus]